MLSKFKDDLRSCDLRAAVSDRSTILCCTILALFHKNVASCSV